MAAQNYCYSCAYLFKKIQSVLSNLSAFKVYFWVWTIYGMASEDYVKISEIKLFLLVLTTQHLAPNDAKRAISAP